jgi:hypothetical protein
MLIAIPIIGYLIWLGIRAAKQRTDGFRRFAETRSLRFIGRTKRFHHYFSVFDLFSRRPSPRTRLFSNLIHGLISDCDLWIFDYHDAHLLNKHSPSRQSVICFESEALSLPRFSIIPVEIVHQINGTGWKRTARRNLRRLTRMFEPVEIELAGRNEFYESYRLGGPNAQAIQRLFDTPVTDLLEQLGSVSVEGDGRKLLIYRESRVVPVAELAQFLEEARSLFALLKSK